MSETIKTFSPIDGALIVERNAAAPAEILEAVSQAHVALHGWRGVSISTRIRICRRFAEIMVAKKDELGLEITEQMGRPIRYAANEIVGMAGRANTMCDLAQSALQDIQLDPKDGFERFIRREPLGVVFAIAPWNYPYLTAVNTVVPALLAGNAVILKHSPQTPLCGERMVEEFMAAGLPPGLLQVLHLTDSDAEALTGSPQIDFVAFTGSVATGLRVQGAASHHICGVGLELGGKDPAYVRADADLEFAIENVVDGAFFNSGQSCCAVERVYVHADVYDAFVEGAVAVAGNYVLGDPRKPETNLGPMVRPQSAEFVRGQIHEALEQGAQPLLEESKFEFSAVGTAYLAPQILVDVNHRMRVMREESFGPVVGIMKVTSDEEAIALMNDSEFGLTASIWSRDVERAMEIGDQLETGTVFLNRCDYLDPELAWVGVKNSGRGCTLSRLGFDQFTRPKSFHLRTG